jgi:copper chaperone CopZ
LKKSFCGFTDNYECSYEQEIHLIILALLFAFVVSAKATEQHVSIEIEGMTCNLCALSVKKALSGVNGVKEVRVSYREKKAWLSIKEKVDNKTLTDAVQKAGPYKVKGIERKPAAN